MSWNLFNIKNEKDINTCHATNKHKAKKKFLVPDRIWIHCLTFKQRIPFGCSYLQAKVVSSIPVRMVNPWSKLVEVPDSHLCMKVLLLLGWARDLKLCTRLYGFLPSLVISGKCLWFQPKYDNWKQLWQQVATYIINKLILYLTICFP